jgi:hypothetical protein
MGMFSKIAGTLSAFFQVGGPSSPGLNANGTALETKNSGNSAFAVHRGASPVGDNDFATKAYVDKTANKPIPATLQFNGNSALPTNSGTEQWYVVTTTGTNATIGQLLWDDGSGSGTVSVLSAVTGNTIITSAALTGGTVSLSATSMYVWNGAAWTNVSPSVSGALFEIRMAVTNAASQSSATAIPANANVRRVALDVQTPYSAGTTISIGQTGSASLLMGTGDNTATLANVYEASQDTGWGASSLAVLVTVAGAPAAGAGFVVVEYTTPNA